MLNAKVINIIEEILKKETIQTDTSKYSLEIYADYYDTIEKDTIIDILNNYNKNGFATPLDYLYDKVFHWYEEVEYELTDNIVNSIIAKINELDIEYNKEEIEEYVLDKVDIIYPINHFLEENIPVNIIIDTGDGEYDFSLNGQYGDLSEINNNNSLLWLTRTQGYSRNQLKKLIHDGHNVNNSDFLKSLEEEILNETTCLNALTFFVNMTLGELLNINDTQNKKIRINKNTNCGLVDFWNGAGSLLNISLEKDLIINSSIIDSISIDGSRRYSVKSIYGIDNSLWNESIEIVQ